MAFRFFAQSSTKARLLAGGTVLGGGFGAVSYQNKNKSSFSAEDAQCQFDTSFGFIQNGQQLIKPPSDWKKPLFRLRNDYPTLSGNIISYQDTNAGLPPIPGPDKPPPSVDPLSDAPWLAVDFKTHPEEFCKVIKAYCLEGNVNNDFVIQENKVRNWYHAPWMHWNINGREPLHGLTFERATPPLEISKTQNRYLQNWAIGFYNAPGATVFKKIWQNPGEPQWNEANFPLGTCVFKILMTNATNEEIPFMKKSPTMQAVIAQQPDPKVRPKGGDRMETASDVRLLQIDFAVRDERAEIGWVFGTFMYNGNQPDKNAWDRIIPVGIMWGNDPELTPTKAEAGQLPVESWINEEATKLRDGLEGQRKSWGFGGRLNGPVDDFRSACASCHSLSQKTKHPDMFPPKGGSEGDIMQYFRNIPAGQPFTAGDVSGDYSLQLMKGYSNFVSWRDEGNKSLWYKTMLKVPFSEDRKRADIIKAKRGLLREDQSSEEDE